MPAFQIKGSYGTMYYVNDMNRSVKWYSTVLGGAKPTFESPEWTEFSLPGGHSICLHIAEKGHKSTERGILIVKVKNIDALSEHLKASNVEISRAKHEVHPGAYSIDVLDSERNLLSFYENTRE